MSTQNITLKFKDVIVKQIVCDAVKMGKDIVPLLKYGPEKKVLFIQGPWIKIKQYGVPAGEKLANGTMNQYYNGEDSRLSFRFPIHPECCVKTDTENNLDNSDEIKDFIKFLQALDSHIKSESTFMSLAGIDLDEKEKYTPIYRKPAKSKKPPGAESKEKFYSMKTKLDTDGKRKDPDNKVKASDDDENDSHKKIKTEIYIVDNETKETKLVNKNKYVTIDQFEENVKFNSEVLPIIQLVKIWEKNGNWGVTLKLKKLRVKNPVYSEMGNVEFCDSDTDVFVSKPTPEHDSESDDEEVTKVVTSHKSMDEPKKPEVKSRLCVDEDDSESDDEPVPVQTKKVTKVVDVDSESDDEEEDVKPKKPSSNKKPVKSKKASA